MFTNAAVILKLILLFDMTTHEVLHPVDAEVDSYAGKVIVSVDGVGVDVGNVIVIVMVIVSLFFNDDGVIII